MFGIKLRKSDLPLLTLLNGGKAPEIPAKGSHYLIVNTDGDNFTVTEREFDANFANKISTAGPALFKLNKRAN